MSRTHDPLSPPPLSFPLPSPPPPLPSLPEPLKHYNSLEKDEIDVDDVNF